MASKPRFLPILLAAVALGGCSGGQSAEPTPAERQKAMEPEKDATGQAVGPPPGMYTPTRPGTEKSGG
jgi:hypothetical protein